jgi:predicted nucleic acid-binding protein
VSSNAHTLPDARSPREALALLRRIVGLPDHVFWQDDISIAASDFIDEKKLHGHRQITDAHVLAVALRHGGRIATFDRGITHLVPAPHSAQDAVCVVLD